MAISGARQDQKSGLSGWGRTYLPGREIRSENLEQASQDYHLSRGLGRSYGDSSLPAEGDQAALGTTLADRILAFDDQTGVIRVEAGLCLAELNRLYLSRHWFTPVTPGTKFVTVGGMVASDVHGKNHHVSGTFGRHVRALKIRTGKGDVVECSREESADLFLASIGGMGLPGHLLEVEFQMEKIPSPWIYTESYRISCLDELLDKLKEKGKEWPMTVAWVDTVARGKSMGRGILFVGRWATPEEANAGAPPPRKAMTMPITLPSGALNRLTIGLFNRAVYYTHIPKKKSGIVDPDKYFYPLDSILHWNRLYGSAGVTQHQSVIPSESGSQGIRDMIETLAKAGTASFLTVIKDCGSEGDGILSFPCPGMSLALDIPINQRTPRVIQSLNATVKASAGRIYLTKDGLSTAEDFQQMETRLPAFLKIKERWDPEGTIRSEQSERLFKKIEL
ncbi:MAG: FAD-binding oxidoreductase [Polyangiaceae bacterium]|nr:FAD-binding oxidoreductase [Polyangiaceae bacterium]